MLNMRVKVKQMVKHVIGETYLWQENWHPLGPIYKTMGCNPIYDSGLGKDALVCDIIVQGSWQWPEANSP